MIQKLWFVGTNLPRPKTTVTTWVPDKLWELHIIYELGQLKKRKKRLLYNALPCGLEKVIGIEVHYLYFIERMPIEIGHALYQGTQRFNNGLYQAKLDTIQPLKFSMVRSRNKYAMSCVQIFIQWVLGYSKEFDKWPLGLK